MRIGGLASGIDTDNIIKELMAAERLPLDKMEQNKTKYEWQRDAFRDINTKIAEFDKLILDMKLSKTYETKKISSSQESAVRATGSSSAMNGTYDIAVKNLASNAINISTGKVAKDVDLSEYTGTDIKFYIYSDKDEAGNTVSAGMQERSITITDDDNLESVLKKINAADKNVRAFYDEQSQQVVLETTRTGNYNNDSNAFSGNEIGFGNNSFFTDILQMDLENEKGGTDAEFTYNGVLDLTSRNNSYTLNGITFNFTDTTGVDSDGKVKSAKLTVTSDTDAAVKKITDFVNKYNELIDALNATQNEAKYRDYPPLTEEQRKEMSEKEIELWEEKAKSGLLKGESIITSALFDLRSGWYEKVENGGAFSYLSEIGISTTRDYLDGGKLEINEDKLKAALESDPASVQKLFSDSSKGSGRGLLNRLEDALDQTVSKIEERAGKGTSTLDNYTLGKRVKSLDEQIAAFEDRLTQIEDRYWRQFTAMEQAISMMNNQSSMLMSFGGTGM